MKDFTAWRRGPLVGTALLAVLLACLPMRAQAQERERRPQPVGFQQADPELAELARDIMLLRGINQIGMTREQIGVVIPALEGMLREERAMRGDIKTLMLQQRRALLKGDVPQDQLDASRRKIKDRAQASKDQVGRTLQGLSRSFSPAQIDGLRALVMTGPGLRRSETGPRDRPAQPPRGPRTMEPPRAGHGDEMGPSAMILERIIALLKEKLGAMPK
jgi:hypothetical protein